MSTEYSYAFSTENGGGMIGWARSFEEAAFLLGANIRYSQSVGRTIKHTEITTYCKLCEGTGHIVKHKPKKWHEHKDSCYRRCPDCKGHDSNIVTSDLPPMAMCGMNAQTETLSSIGHIAEYKPPNPI